MAGKQAKSEKATVNKYPFWSPRAWHGMNLGPWLALLIRNRFAVSLSRIPMVATISLFAVANSLMSVVQLLMFARRIRWAPNGPPPVFIIGHWRSGTTHLHELMVLDERFAYPTTYECGSPTHCLVTGWWVTRLPYWIPAQRPMDNMAFGWRRPQEDEFALATLGLGSPYETIAFPNKRPLKQEYLTLERVSPAERETWKQGFWRFYRLVNFRSWREARRQAGKPRGAGNSAPRSRAPRRIIFKSPPHTARIKVLRELFPEACFVHIVRNPYSLFSSTVRLWKSLYETQGLQVPKFEALPGGVPSVEEHVLHTFNEMYESFDQQQAQVPPGQFCELKYEDLIRDPIGELRRVYEQLGLGGFEDVRPKMETYLASLKDYQTNRHQIAPETQALVDRHWGDFIRKYGYAGEPAATATS